MSAASSKRSRCCKRRSRRTMFCPQKSEAMDCPSCTQTDVLEIEHLLPDGTEVRFFACHNCEQKWWNRDGEDIDISQVLEIVRQSRT